MKIFEITPEQLQKYKNWSHDQDAKAVAKQKEVISKTDAFYNLYKTSWEMGYPYSGAIGGADTFCFTPTGLGSIVTVKNKHTGETLDLTSYEDW